jgi:hypothetical protein
MVCTNGCRLANHECRMCKPWASLSVSRRETRHVRSEVGDGQHECALLHAYTADTTSKARARSRVKMAISPWACAVEVIGQGYS